METFLLKGLCLNLFTDGLTHSELQCWGNLRSTRDNNICITELPEEEERERARNWKTYFEK